jgi:hypothetical protein
MFYGKNFIGLANVIEIQCNIIVSKNKSQMCFSHTKRYQLSDLRGGANIDPKGMIYNSFVEANKGMLHVRYLNSRHYSFTTLRLICVFLYKTVSTKRPNIY